MDLMAPQMVASLSDFVFELDEHERVSSPISLSFLPYPPPGNRQVLNIEGTDLSPLDIPSDSFLFDVDSTAEIHVATSNRRLCYPKVSPWVVASTVELNGMNERKKQRKFREHMGMGR